MKGRRAARASEARWAPVPAREAIVGRPREYLWATRDVEWFPREARGHAITHRICAMLHCGFAAFRSRLSARDGLIFASALPPVLRALSVDDGSADTSVRPFADRGTRAALSAPADAFSEARA